MSKVFKVCNNFLNFKLTAIHLNKNKLFNLQLKSFARSLNNINKTKIDQPEQIKENIKENIKEDTQTKKNKFDFENENDENYENEKSNIKEKKEITEYIYGRKACEAVLKTNFRKINEVLVLVNYRISPPESIKNLIDLSVKKGLKVKYATKPKLDKVSLGRAHSGVVLRCSRKSFIDVKKLSDLNLPKNVGNVVCIIDGVSDQYNVASLIRSCLYFGSNAIVFNRQDRPSISNHVANISGGASELVQLYSIRFIKKFALEAKKENFVIISTKADKDKNDDNEENSNISNSDNFSTTSDNTCQEINVGELNVDLSKQNVILILTAEPENHKNCVDFHVNITNTNSKDKSKLKIVESLNSCVSMGVILDHLRNRIKI